jgi:hypothetical protein
MSSDDGQSWGALLTCGFFLILLVNSCVLADSHKRIAIAIEKMEQKGAR